MHNHDTALCCAMTITAAALMAGSCIAQGQDYPTRVVRIYTAAAGGGVDFAARLIAQGLAANMGQSVIVENRGGSSLLAAEPVMKAPPDGHTLIFYGSGFWLTPF